MNFKTTLVLTLLVAAAAGVYWKGPEVQVWIGLAAPATTPDNAGSLAAIRNLQPDAVTRIQVKKPNGVVALELERGAGGEWTLPGKWPARKPEAESLVALLTHLQPRFAPESVSEAGAEPYGFTPASTYTVILQSGGQDVELKFAEKPDTDAANRFSRPTYLMVGGHSEVVRLAPGIIAALDRPLDYYQQRRLFPSERVAKDADSSDKVERLVAKSVAVKESKSGGVAYTLQGAGSDWEIQQPVKDRVDPEKLKSLLTAVPDIWAEKFVEKPKADLAEYGLKEPEQTLNVTRPSGDTVTLLIGKESHEEKRTVSRPAPPSQFGQPTPPIQDVVIDKYRFAKVQNNDQIFEIKADKLKDVFVTANTLRDSMLARFKTEDARRLEIIQGGQTIVLAKDKDKWKIEKPLAAEAETSKINELLDKLNGLQARDADIVDKADPKATGLDKPAGTLKVTVEEEVKGEGDAKTKKTKSFAFTLGQPEKPAADKPKLNVKVEGWDRVNAVDDGGLLALVKRPALAYRNRRVLDVATSDIDQIEVQRAGETVGLKLADGKWKLTAPIVADVDAAKVSKLTGDLSNLEAVEYVTASAKPEELDKDYGLAKPAVTAAITFTKKETPSQRLLVGKQRRDKPEYFAKLASANEVFVIEKETFDALNENSLAYRPLQLWQMQPSEITLLRIQKDGQEEYRLAQQSAEWKITSPFEASVVPNMVQTLTADVTNVRADKCEAHTAKDPAAYGFDKPYLRLTVTQSKKEDQKTVVKDQTLVIGKVADQAAGTRYAKQGDSDAVYVVGSKLVTAVDHSALDLLDRKLLSLDSKTVEKLQNKDAKGGLTLQRQGDNWQVVGSPAPAFAADNEVVAGVLGVWSNLRADKFAAYGPKADLAKFGLDKPERTVTVTVQPPAGPDGKKPAAAEHTIVIGKPVEGAPADRYARVDNGPGVAVLPSFVVAELTHSHLDFVNHALLKFDAAAVTTVTRRMGNETVELSKKPDGWHITKPKDQRGDDPSLSLLVDELAHLHATKIAAYPSGDPKQFGLNSPAARVVMRESTMNNTKVTDFALLVGNVADPATGDRYAQVEGSQVVGVISNSLAKRLVADPITFRDRTLANLQGVDKITLERGSRKAVFTKADGAWKMTEPLAADAEQNDLDDFVNAVSKLRADELIAEKPGDLKPFGLDKPESKWRFDAAGKEVLTLLVGGKEKNGSRYYAKAANGDLIALLDAGLSTRVAGEFRSRTIWSPAPDAAQVEFVRFGYVRDPFILEKKDNAWHVAGKPEIKVKQEAVGDALAAVASVRAARYVVDKGADLKLYGLEPPELVLEVDTQSGKKTLQIGRPEGDSKRYYVRVPEAGRTDVFVISEADAARIVRPLAAFK